MDGSKFDEVSRLFARRRLSRRQALAQASAGLAAAGLAAAGVTAVSAQDATPPADPGPPDAARGPEMLFLQSFQSGSIVPTDGAEGRYTVTLEQGLGQTIYFSDRPDRIVGASPTPRFLEKLGFPADNPPNAALLVQTTEGDTDIAVVELFNPTYDEASHTATYEVAVLANWEDSSELGFTDAPSDLAALAPSFGAAHLFIDGCSESVILCRHRVEGGEDKVLGSIGSEEFGGWTYAARSGQCLPAEPWYGTYDAAYAYWQGVCNARYAECDGNCTLLGF